MFDVNLNNHLSEAVTELLQCILCKVSDFHLKNYTCLLQMREKATLILEPITGKDFSQMWTTLRIVELSSRVWLIEITLTLTYVLSLQVYIQICLQ